MTQRKWNIFYPQKYLVSIYIIKTSPPMLPWWNSSTCTGRATSRPTNHVLLFNVCEVSSLSGFVHLNAVHKDASFYAKIILCVWRICCCFLKIRRVSRRFVIKRNVTQRRAFPYLRHDECLTGVQPRTSQNLRQWRTLFWSAPRNAPCSNGSHTLVWPCGTPQFHHERCLTLEFVLFSWFGTSFYVSVAL